MSPPRARLVLALALVLWACGCSVPRKTPPSSFPANGVTNYRRIDDGLATGGKVAPAVVSQLVEAGFATIIDLRAPTEEGVREEAAAAERAGLRYVNIPVTPGTLTAETVRQVAAVLDRDDSHPVLLHCSSGNRVGGVMQLYREQVHDVSPAVARAEASAIGLHTPEMIEAVERVRREMQSGR